MSKKTKAEVVKQMRASGLVPVYNHADAKVCKSVLKACYDGGLRVFEFTKRSSSAYEVFCELRSYVDQEMPDMLIGVGSIIDAETTEQFIKAGADFIVSPALVPEMAVVCKNNEIVWAPGCGTVSEIVQAQKLGADITKLFPGEQVGGPAFAKAVLGPLPWSMLMPTGGVTPEEKNLKAWFNAGVCCVGLGSNLFPKDWIESRDFQKITALVKNTLAIINDIRKV